MWICHILKFHYKSCPVYSVIVILWCVGSDNSRNSYGWEQKPSFKLEQNPNRKVPNTRSKNSNFGSAYRF